MVLPPHVLETVTSPIFVAKVDLIMSSNLQVTLSNISRYSISISSVRLQAHTVI